MAELYDQKKIYAKLPTAQPAEGVDGELEAMLAELPPEERDAARQYITAAPTGEDVYKAMQEKNANGEVFNMNLDQYRLYKSYIKNKETDIIETMGQAAGAVFDEIQKAGGSIVDDPTGALAKLTPSAIEAFAQGTRSLYGMAAQSQDPTSVFFRVKNALSANGDDEAAEFQQFMDAQAFNVHSMRLATGQDTLVMDKDVINPEMTQVMSYIADPTLVIPFGGIAAKGARLVGMGEGLAKASARAAQIQNKILGGTLKWGVGAPIEFLGTATRNTIDFGLEKAGSAFETVTGMSAAEAKATANLYGQYSISAALEGRNVALPIAGDIAGAMVGSTTAKGVGEAISMVGEQMLKQQKHGRGVLSYAGQALRDADKAGVPLSKHARALLNVIDKADPLFVYSADLAKGAGEGMAIGAGLGFLSAGEEGAASGAGAGLALGTVGAGLGSVASDIGNGRLYDRIAVQRKMVIEGLRQVDPAKASAFEALVAAVETTGNRDYIAQTDGIIAGIDLAAPNAKFNIRDKATHIEWLRSQNIDPDTGRLAEPSAILPEFGGDRKSRARVLSFLGMANERFKTKDELLGFIKTLPQDHSFRKEFFRLSDQQKQVVFDTLGKNQDAEYRKKFGNKSAGEFYKDLNYGEANVARVNAMFDSGNITRANEMIRQMLKDETVNGQLTERGKLLKEKLATEGYFDKDGNMRPSRLKDVELTAEAYADSAGFVIRRDSTGQVEININLDAFGRDTVPHELFHAVMMESAFKPDFLDRLTQNLLGKFDANGKMIERPSVDTNQVKKFFTRYIDALHGRNPTERDNQIKRLDAAIKEYESRGTTNKISEAGNDSLEVMVEEFGAYYFGKFINDKPVDFLFRGGELGAMREMLGNAKQGWLDFWRSKIKGQNPTLDFDNIEGTKITTGFGKDGVRARVTALDLFMRDFVRATAMANKQGGFDISRLSPEAQQTFIKNQGIRVYGNADANGRIGRKNQRQILSEQIKTGKEIYKILSGLDPALRKGLTIDGEGNLSGRLSPEAMEALVQSGHIDRAWVDKIQNAYNILDGNGSNVINFGYLGRTAQIGDYAWPRLVGNAVPFKNRAAVLLDVDFKVGKDGKMYALFHTLDKAVIDGRADVLWSDSAIRQLWNNDRAAMDADFFRYLSNASKASSDNTRVESSILLEDGTGKGAMRRNVLHQMLGMVKPDGETYLNKPIAEIPYGIRHSVTTFNVDGISNMRVASGGRWDVVPQNAFRDLARNFQPAEMSREQTPNGSIISHPLGYKFTERNGKVQAFDDNGNRIGIYDDIYKASEAAKKHNESNTAGIIESINKTTAEQSKQGAMFQVLERDQRGMAIRDGDVFEVPQMKSFTAGVKNIIRQTREEYVIDKAELDLVEGSDAFYIKLIQRNRELLAKHYYNDSRYAEALANFEKSKQETEEAYESNILAYKNGQISPEEYNARADQILIAFKKALKEKNEAEPSINSITNDFIVQQQARMLTPMFEAHAEGDWKQQLINGEIPKLSEEGLRTLNNLAKKQIEAYRTNAVQGLPEAVSAVYSDEYNQQFQTGVPFVTIATHGTANLDLMIGREFRQDKLGSKYPIYSSQNGVFFAGQQSTSGSYAAKGKLGGGTIDSVLRKNSPEWASAQDELTNHIGMVVDTILNMYYNDALVPTFEQFKKRFKFDTDEAAMAAYKMHKDNFRVLGETFVSTKNLDNGFKFIFGYGLESPHAKGAIHYEISNTYGVSPSEVLSGGNSTRKAEALTTIRRRFIKNALEIGTPKDTVFNPFGKGAEGSAEVLLDIGGGNSAARMISDSYNLLSLSAKEAGNWTLDMIGVPPEARDYTSTYYEGVRNSVDSRLERILAESKNVPMELRAAIRMDNPLVIEGRKEYGEYYLKDIMKPAIKAGHDGVIFRNMRDGGKFDNIYVVFRDYMNDKIMTLDTSFDEQGVPRGNDANGNKVRYGKELGLRHQPAERDAGGRVYDQNSKEFKFGFIGKWAEENPERLKGYNIEFIDRGIKYGNHGVRIRMQDNSVKGKTEDVGHITADIDPKTMVASLSSHIGVKYRGNKLSYALYSEMAERLRSMGVTKVDGTIINQEGIPIKIREKIIGNTKVLRSDGSSGVPIDYQQGARIIQKRQAEKGNTWGGLDVVNELDPKARYQPAEIPEGLGTSKVKDGYVRMYHQTTPENIQSIVKNGLLVSKTRASSESRGVSIADSPFYGTNNPNLVTIEVQVPRDKLKQANGSALQSDIPASDILAVHEPWHENARYIEKNPETLKEVLNGDMDFMLGDNSPEAKAIEYIKNKHSKDKPRYQPAEGEHPWTTEIARAQRDLPEDAMKMAQRQLGGGAVGFSIEHAGDILHRTYEYVAINDGFGYNTVLDKVNKVLRAVQEIQKVGILEVEERNYPYVLADKKKGTGKTWEEHKQVIKDVLGNFAKEHEKLPAYNDLQKTVKTINTSLGRLDFLTAEMELLKLRRKLKSEESWTQYASEGIDAFQQSKGGSSARMMPSEYQGGDDYWKKPENIFESKDDQGFLIRKASAFDKDNRLQWNKDRVSWTDIGHFFGWGGERGMTDKMKNWVIKNSGLYEMGVETNEFNKLQPYTEKERTVKLLKPTGGDDLRDITHALWFDGEVYKETKDYSSRIYGRYELPKYAADGTLERRGRISINQNTVSSFKELVEAKKRIVENLGLKEDDVDAYFFGQNKEIKNSQGLSQKDELPIKFQPAEESTLSRRYDLDQQIVDKLKKSFKFPYKLNTAKDMLQFIIDNNGHMAPLAKEMISSLDDHGLKALVSQQTTTLGANQKGTKGWTYHNYHPSTNRANMVLERNLETRRKYNQVSYEELMIEEILHALTIAKSPAPLRHGSTIEDTLKNVEHFLRNKEKYSEHYDPAFKTISGFSEEWWTIADAYKKVHDQFLAGKYVDGSEMTKSEKNTIAYRLSNMGEFTVGVTQTKEVQKILSQIKVPKKEGGLLSGVFNAIKRIWGFGDEVMGSLLEHTSDAMEKVIKRPKKNMEEYDSGRYPQRAKEFFSGFPESKFQPAEQRNVNYSSNDERVKYLMSVIDNVPHYKKAFDSGQLSIDAYKPEEFKDFDVLSHAPDTASTVEQKNFKAQGGVGYPLLFPEEGWAAVSRGLEKRLNAIGEMNLKKHGKWIAPMALVLSHAQKMQGARNGTEGFINIIKQLEDKKVISNETLRAALVRGLKSIGTEINDNAQMGDAMFATYKMLENSTSSGFKKRAKFVGNVAGSIATNTGNLSKRQINALKEIIPNYTGNKTITKKELIPTIFQMFADPLVQGLDAPDPKTGGDVYAFVLFDKPLVESESSPHSSYKYSVRQEDNSPVRVDLLSRPMKTLEMFKQKRTKKGVAELKEKTVVNDTGQRNFPYGRVIHAQPAEGFRDWKAEQTTAGSLIKNSAGFVISRIGSKYRVYNPYKAVIGVYDNEEQAKRRVQREEPKR